MSEPASAPQDAAGGGGAHAASPAQDGELLELAVRAARLGGGLLAQRARAGAERSVASKSTPTDLVSEADLASERAIRELLEAHRPQDGFVGEEEGASRAGSSGLSWVVDPLDGTVNFLFGIPQWCVSVAVRDATGGVLAGAIYDPNRDELFTATREGDARREGRDGQGVLAGRTSAVAADGAEGDAAELGNAMIATGLYYDAGVRSAQAKVLERLVGRVRDIRRFGSAALDLAWTAAGRYDAYFERGVQQWDIAAGALLCRRAGLTVIDLAPAADLPAGVLAGPPALVGALRELM